MRQESLQLRLKCKPWYQDGHKFAPWTDPTKRILHQSKNMLFNELTPHLTPSCTHIKGKGGIKGTVKDVAQKLEAFQFAARFDVASYYRSLDHQIIKNLLDEYRISNYIKAIVEQYLSIPDTENHGIGIVAGGALSPLLGAMYFLPLDKAMQKYIARGDVYYVRFMDDILVLAKKKWQFKKVVKEIQQITQGLGLRLHDNNKRFIGRIDKGFEFLGYHFYPGRKLRPSSKSLQRLTERAGRLYEQGAGFERLRLYVLRWTSWLWGKLAGLISLKGGVKRYLVHVLKQLPIKLSPRQRSRLAVL